MDWLNEPKSWREIEGGLEMEADALTDFWRKTGNDLVRDNGHFFHQPVAGGFVVQVKFSGDYGARYDQAGIMVRQNAEMWMKCGIEYVDGVHNASAVVTRGYSDWSVVPLEKAPEAVWFRVERTGAALMVHYSLDGEAYTMIRTATLTADPVAVGLMTAAPEGNGFGVRFEEFELTG